MKNIKRIIALAMVLLSILAVLAACKDESVNPVTLDSLKTAVTEAGYEINFDSEDNKDVEDYKDIFPEELVSWFQFDYGSQRTVGVYELTDKENADIYAKSTGGNFLILTNDKFVLMSSGPESSHSKEEKTFLENLINGRSVK